MDYNELMQAVKVEGGGRECEDDELSSTKHKKYRVAPCQSGFQCDAALDWNV